MSLGRSTIQLSLLDLLPPKYYTRLALSFRTPETANRVLARLQDGIERVSQSIPWLSGRVVSAFDEANKSAGLQVQWHGSDVPQVRYLGSLAGAYEEAANAGMPLNTIPQDRFPAPSRITDELHCTGLQVFTAGLLSFEKGGGVILAICVHHNVSDAGGMAEIIKAWSDILAGKSSASYPSAAVDRTERLSRALGQRLGVASHISTEELLKSHPGYKASPLYFPLEPTTCTSEIITISLDKIAKLKSEVGEASFLSRPTVNTLLCAVLWIALTRTRSSRDPSLFACPNTQSVLGMPINGRARIGSDFSTSEDPYFGNVYIYTVTELDPRLALSSAPVPSPALLAELCSAIAATHSPASIDADNIAGLYQLVKRFDKFPALFPAWSITSGTDLAVTSWANLGLYEMDFGDGLGCPEFVRLPYTSLDSAGIVLPKKKGSGVMELIVMLRKDDLEMLKKDDIWGLIAV